MEFGDRLASRRKDMGLSQEALGEGLGTDGKAATKQTVVGWEKGRHFPKVDQLRLICERLNCSADWLVFGATAALSPLAIELAQELDTVADMAEQREAFNICRGTIRMASSHPKHGIHEITQAVTRRAS